MNKEAEKLGVEVAALKAVAHVESNGIGFLLSGQPKILFERHVFYKLTKGRFALSHPDLCNRQPGGYGRSGLAQHVRLARAAQLDSKAAYESASWGAFQIMGYHWALCGYPSLDEFLQDAYSDEAGHLRMLVGFLNANTLLVRALRAKDWRAFARRYNGPAYTKNQYDTKLAAAYAHFSQMPAPPPPETPVDVVAPGTLVISRLPVEALPPPPAPLWLATPPKPKLVDRFLGWFFRRR